MLVTEPLELATGAAVWDVFANTFKGLSANIIERM